MNTKKRVEFRTRRLILRTLKKTDYAAWFDAYARALPKKTKWDRGPLPDSKCTRAWFDKVRREYRDLVKKDDYYRYYVFERKTGAIVGHIDFDIFLRSTHQFANFGYQIYNRHWGRGYGREAARVGLRIGFRQLKLNRLEAAINLDNKKSLRLAKLIGMRREGIKKRYWFEDGRWVDHIIYVANPEDLGLRAHRPF